MPATTPPPQVSTSIGRTSRQAEKAPGDGCRCGDAVDEQRGRHADTASPQREQGAHQQQRDHDFEDKHLKTPCSIGLWGCSTGG